jgi:hypothetical protein
MVRVIEVPVGTAVADSEKPTEGALSLIIFIAVALLVVEPELSVAFTYTVNMTVRVLPVDEYA